jgi:uncharacterized protein YdeI (YjbR/CyaY-like superfamily)
MMPTTTSDPVFFESPNAFRRWLDKHHQKETELWVGYHKVKTGKPSLTWPQSVDHALCYGWIDGIRRSLGEEGYMIRFTPRTATSIWSAVNIKRAKELIAEGLMKPAGQKAFETRDEKRANRYSYERDNAAFSAEQEKEFRKNKPAWGFFSEQPPWYRKLGTHYVVSAKRAETQTRRLATLIADSAAGRRLNGIDEYSAKRKS